MVYVEVFNIFTHCLCHFRVYIFMLSATSYNTPTIPILNKLQWKKIMIVCYQLLM